MKFLNTFAVILIVAIFVFLALVVLKVNSVPQAAHDVMVMIVGGLLTTMAAVVQYFFGSSHGSAKKNETIDAMLNGKTEQAANPEEQK